MTVEIIKVTDDTDAPTVRELLEARCRRLMARRAGLPNQWPHRGERAELLVDIDATLTAFNDASA